MQVRLQTPAETAAFDFRAIVLILRRRIGIVILTALIFAGLTAAYSLTAQPVYRASARLLIDPSVRQPFENPNLSQRGLLDDAFVDSQVAIIGSDAVLRPVARQFDLKNDPEFGDTGPSGLVSQLRSLFGGGADGTPEGDARRETEAIREFSKAVEVSREGLTYVVSVSVDSSNPDKSTKLAQAIADTYLADRGRQRESSTDSVNEQIGTRLVALREKLRADEAAVQQFKSENRLQSSGDAGLLTTQELSELNTQLSEAQAGLAEKQARYDKIAAFLKNGVNPNSINEISESDNVANLREQYTLAVRQVANLESQLLPRHPTLIRARSEVGRLEGLLRAEAQNASDVARIDMDVARERVANLERALDTSRSNADTGDEAMIRLRELETEAQTTRTLYQSALARMKEIAELDQIVVPSARIIAPALPWESAVWPKKKLLVATAALLGLMVGVILAIGGEVYRQVSLRLFAEPAARDFDLDEELSVLMTDPADDIEDGYANDDHGQRGYSLIEELVRDADDLPEEPAAPRRNARGGGFSLLDVGSAR